MYTDVVMMKYKSKILIILYLCLVCLTIWLQGTHEVKMDCINKPPCSFSLWNIELLDIGVVIVSYALFFLGWFYYTIREKKVKIDHFSLFPLGEYWWSKSIAIFLSVLHVISVLVFYLLWCLYCVLMTGRWLRTENMDMITVLLVCGIIFWGIIYTVYGCVLLKDKK